MRAIIKLHVAVYRLTGGRLLGGLRGAPVLLLTTRGRKSGKDRTVPLLYLENGEDYVVVASYGGSPRHPAWYRNLQAHPEARIESGKRATSVTARTASKQERDRLWPRVVEMYPAYETYQRKTTREIPLVVLEKATS